MLRESAVKSLLAPFGLDLSSGEVGQLLTYLDLLQRWNRKINLTAIEGAEEWVTRHFGESLYLSRWVELKGKLIDIGSGAGFPGLALKIVFPELATTLLEPAAKKRAFLKEVARACGMESVEVRGERLEDFVSGNAQQEFNSATSRAVGHLDRLVPLAAECLVAGGGIYLWVGRGQGQGLTMIRAPIVWKAPLPLPLARQREIWLGQKAEGSRQ